ncbi:uncharacterized protein LOC126739589 [Anthonomus grandis grandis]|uniref:uncharacterized protein LOC126739589 n=1 Tax=Anthonomus grandis grandis TaxID=2921223 RepID=UPI00216514E7|nr:uncharacterized protein LOC126739589 [Anthonomus grandis grandis]
MNESFGFENASQAKLIRHYQTNLFAQKNLLLKIWFLQQSLLFGLTPKFINLKCKIRTNSSKTAVNVARTTRLKEEVKCDYRTLNKVNSLVKYLYFTLNSFLNHLEFSTLDCLFRDKLET